MKTKPKCIIFCATYCCKYDFCEVYSKDLTYADEIDDACLRCKHNVGCRECLHYEYCEKRGTYE